jgi:hypothetical protein
MATYRQNFTEPLNLNGGYCLALAIGWGKDADGNDVASRMHTMIYNKRKNTIKTLEETYPNAAHYVAPYSASLVNSASKALEVSKSAKSNILRAADVVVPVLAPIPAENDLTKWLDEAAKQGVEIVPINLQKLGAHPHATM